MSATTTLIKRLQIELNRKPDEVTAKDLQYAIKTLETDEKLINALSLIFYV